MIREQKNKFWLTLILILSLSFSAFALGIANVFNNRKTNQTLPVDAAEEENFVGNKIDTNNDGEPDLDVKWIKNKGETDEKYVEEIGTMYGGTTISVATATELNPNGSDDETWHSTLQITVSGSNTETNGTYQPYIQNGYELEGFYFYAGSTQYGDLFEAGESATTEQIDPEYKGNITVKAVCKPIEYNLTMYYSKDGTTWKEKPVDFNVKQSQPLGSVANVVEGDSERTFKHWAILTDYVEDAGEGLLQHTSNKGIKFASDKIVHTAGDGKTYYYITSVQGYSSTIPNDWFTGTKNESSFNPAIRAVWSYVYNGLIDNNYTFHTNLPNEVDEENVIGAVSSDDVNNADGNYKIAKLKIADTGNYKYPFMTNTGTAFYYKNDAENSKVSATKGNYYVYNYGYEITGWKIYFSYDNSTCYLMVQSGENDSYFWDVDTTIESGNNKINSNEFLSKTNTSDLASFCKTLDAHFISGYDPRTIITMKPVWQAAHIQVKIADEVTQSQGATSKFIAYDGNDSNLNVVTYGSNYRINDDINSAAKVFVSPGQMIYAYGFTKEEPSIAKNHNADPMPWNYVNIAQDQFVYDSNVYTLTVEPICVDNIYKILLNSKENDVSLGANGEYTLAPTSNDQYKFAVGSEQADEIVDITEANLTNKFDHYSTGSIEAYITNVVSKTLTEYNNKIDEDKINGTLDILRKVFTTNERATANGLTCTLPTGETTEFYIYLANNHKAGDLPVFEYGHYDLIAWENENNNYQSNANYAYITEKYNSESHAGSFNNFILKNLSNEELQDLPSKEWKLSEMNEERVLKAHFFRKYYLLDLNTLREETENQEGRYGYILIEIEDDPSVSAMDNKSGKFIALFQDGKMQYFDVSDITSGINVNSIVGKTIYDATTETIHSKGLIEYQDSQCFVKLYGGCKLTVTSSCVDYLWENTGDDTNKFPYLDMVGYYLSSVGTTSKLPNGNAGTSWFGDVVHDNISNQTAGKHVITLESGDKDTPGTIEGAKCPSGSKIAINAYFAPIDYEITISLKTNDKYNPFAGRVGHNNQSTTNENATITFNAVGGYVINVEKGWPYAIEYLANAGYTLSENAFATYEKDSTVSHVLQSYNSSNTSQSYPFALNSAWLINHYYKTTYDATPQTLAIDVNTEVFNFNYNIEIVDESGKVLEVREYLNAISLDGKTDASNIVLITYDGETFDKLSKKLIGKEFEKINASEDFYVIKILTCTNVEAGHTHTPACYTNYVVMESLLPYSVLGNNNYKTVYEFLLKGQTLENGTGESNDILTQSVMNNIFGFGEIVNNDDRVLTVRIKVSELYTITLKAEQHSTLPDPGLGNRTTTIKNHDIGFGNYTNSGTLTTSGSDFTNSVVIYTYKGVENVLSSTFNEVAYDGVTYRLGGSSSNLEGNVFTLDETKVDATGNIDVWVTYEPKPIETFNVTYQLNGIEDSSIFAKRGEATTGKLIEETKYRPTKLYFGGSFYYGYQLLNEGYIVSITLNGSVVQVNDENTFACVVNEQTYQSGGFFIIVNVISVQKENATIMYVLDETEKAFADDVYGGMEVFVGTTNVTPEPTNGMYIVSVAAEKKLSVDISGLAKGYSFVSLKQASTPLTTTLPENNKLVITNSFNFEENNTYYVVIKKDTIRATLTLDNDVIYKDNYTMSGNTKSVDAYLGKTLEFTNVDKDKEVLNYYYYIDKDGVTQKIKPDGNGEITLQLTTDVLNQLGDKVDGVYNINIGVKTTKKYKLTYSVVNEIYAKPVELTVVDSGETYQNGTYMLDGTKINVNILAKDNVMNIDGVTIDEAKYDITLSDCDIVDANGNVLTNAEKKVKFTEGVANGFVVLDADKTLTITITQKTYSTTNNEYIYNDIDNYNSLTPTPVDADDNIGSFEVDGEVDGVVKYGDSVTARFNRDVVGKGKLAVIRLSGNDSNDLIIHIKDKQITSVYDATNNVEYIINDDNAKHSTVTGVTLETVTNLKDKLQEFGYNFNINNSDIVEITYIVKNAIEIETEYLSYKTITPII